MLPCQSTIETPEMHPPGNADLNRLLNSFVNFMLTLIRRKKMSFSKKIKSRFKNPVKFMNDFELTAAGSPLRTSSVMLI